MLAPFFNHLSLKKNKYAHISICMKWYTDFPLCLLTSRAFEKKDESLMEDERRFVYICYRLDSTGKSNVSPFLLKRDSFVDF